MNFSKDGKVKPAPTITVFLLVENILAAKDLSAVFRKIGIIPQYFSTLEKFWKAALEEDPTMAIIDVKKMHEGSLVLKEHPKVKSERFPIVFFYNRENLPLLRSIYDVYHLGVLEEGSPYDDNIQRIFNRIQKMFFYQGHKDGLQQKIENLIQESRNLKMNLIEREKKEKSEKIFHQLTMGALRLTPEGDFGQFCNNVFDQWEELYAFSVLELTGEKSKLLSPELSSPKYRRISSLNLTSTCKDGLDQAALNLGMETAVQKLGGDCIVLNIQGELKRPQVILYISPSKQMDPNFPWASLEGLLNGIYGRFTLRKMSRSKEDLPNYLAPWEMMNKLDEIFYQVSTINRQLIDLNFFPLLKFLEDVSYIRFRWNKFYKDFFQHLGSTLKGEYQSSIFGTHHVAFLIDKKEEDIFLKSLKKAIREFKYEYYVESEESLPWEEIHPIIKIISMSSNSYLKILGSFYSNKKFEKTYTQRNKEGILTV